ncbi:hypothetical protein ALI144C_09720 [Actinosynnema sp. ALI-1.44]|nr:recombinase family protein [Actinosynnema sp. ALI-1.44]ONI86923.1 hypothetical protein ALI144C_09720 [Actinosynnema sp. ALI-1.44]
MAYGYRLQYDPDSGKSLGWVIDPEQAKVVRMIVDDILAGKSRSGIAKRLNAQGVPPPRPRWFLQRIRGLVEAHQNPDEWARLLARMSSEEHRAVATKIVERVRAGEAPRNIRAQLNKDNVPYVLPMQWSLTTITKIALSKPAAGLRVYQGQVMTEVVTDQDGRTVTDEHGEPVTRPIKVQWEPIITRDEHTRLSLLLSKTRTGPLRDGERVKYWWSGIAVCGVCDSPVTRSTDEGTGRYQCRARGCVSRQQDLLDAWLMEQAVQLLERPDAARLFRLQEQAADASKAERELVAARAELEKWRTAAGAGEVSLESFSAIEPGLLDRVGRAQRHWDRATAVAPILQDVIGPQARQVLAELTITQLRAVLRHTARSSLRGMVEISARYFFEPCVVSTNFMPPKYADRTAALVSWNTDATVSDCPV